MKKEVVIVENPSELGAGTRGAGTGPFAVRLQDNQTGNLIYGQYPHITVETYNGALCRPVSTPNAKYINEIVDQNNRLIDVLIPIFEANKFPLILSGDHSNALGTIAAIKDFNINKRLGVIWIDAHADLHTPYTSPSGNVHGMPLGASLGEGYESKALNSLSSDEIEGWHSLTHLGHNQIHPKLLPQDLVFIAIRDLEDAEWNDVLDNNIKHYGPTQLRTSTMPNIAKETLDYLRHCDLIYISFDVDSMDPSVSEGTGTSVSNGLSLDEAKTLLSCLFKTPNLVALEITEINPLIDDGNKMAKASLGIMRYLIA